MPTVLVVDDDAVDQEQARRCLQALDDTEVLLAGDGAAALEILARGPVDLVVSDLRMPGMDGIELVERIRDEFPSVPVLIITSMGSERIAARALQAGAASYVPKSDLEEMLARTVLQLLVLSEGRRERRRVLPHLRSAETRFELPNDPRLITPVVSFLQENLERLGFGGERLRTQVAVAITEALTNAMLHGNLETGPDLRQDDRTAYDRLVALRQEQEPFRSRRVHLTAWESPLKVRYSIRDEGRGFDRAGVPDPTRPENLALHSGRGLFLMRTFMDTVEHNQAGNEVTLTRGAPPGEAAD